MPEGLTSAEVAERVAAGAVNSVRRRTSRPLRQVLRANLVTRFNALIAVLCGLVLIFGQPIDAGFGLVIVVNSAVGVVQELRARKVLDSLAVLAEAPVRVRRDGRELSIASRKVVVDDVVLLGPGEEVPVDGTVRDSDGMEIDESLLTGEAEPVGKQPGSEVRSGTFVAAGSGLFTATRVGADSYAARLVAAASVFDLTDSELMRGINRFLRLVTWIIVPVGALLVVRLFLAGSSVSDAVVGSVAGIVPMIPEGLVLMTSVAFAVGVIRLGRHRCLVQELPAVEVLARVDTLCIDKTGTLTEPGMALKEVRPLAGVAPETVRTALVALAGAEANPNPTMAAIAAGLSDTGWHAHERIPFSSTRKFSGATFGEHGTWLVGAPEVLLPASDPVRSSADELAAGGLRVLVLAQAPGLDSHERAAAALVVVEQRIRADAPDTVRYLAAQGIDVKVVSGDNPATVAAIARKVGVPGADDPVDGRSLTQDPAALADTAAGRAVFGRVSPQQKQEMVSTLRSRGRTVAMTGDGVNDALALTAADLGVAMGSGSPATRTVAKIVLLDDTFSALPRVLAEGRRVLGNIERVANLYLTKTVYALLIALLVGVARLPFPFLPRHITLVGTLTIGVPSFFLALAPTDERARPGFVPRVLRFAVPAGLVAALATFAAYAIGRRNTASSLAADRSTATLTLFLVAFWILALVARPYTPWRLGLLAAMAAGFGVVALVPGLRHVAALTFPDPRDTLTAAGVSVLAALALLLLRHRPAGAERG
ncbi:HAD-IC family P-type ATPase [Micromonospora peucetia]|uniref:HAD-IC family P-type ATPase n=1 Tax=Micromonospora peucetia TaxID=47871 RepID=UPI0033288C61